MRGHAKDVSKADKEKIRQMWLDGHRAAYIAKETGRDRKTIYNVVADLPKRREKYTGGIKEKVVPLLPEIHARYMSGERLVDIAGELGASQDYLITLLKKADYPIREQGWNFGKYDIGPHAFIEAWQISDSLEEVCERLQMPRSAVSSRASKYRSQGVPLKAMYHHGELINWNELAEFAKSFREEE